MPGIALLMPPASRRLAAGVVTTITGASLVPLIVIVIVMSWLVLAGLVKSSLRLMRYVAVTV